MSGWMQILREQRRPGKFLLSRLLMRSGLSRLFTIRQPGFRLRFFPTSLSASLWIDPADHQAEARFFRRYLRPGDVVIDVGANIGLTTLAASRLVGDSGRVVAIEPHPRIFDYLAKNLRLNGVRNVVAHQAACGAEEGTLRLSDLRADDQNHVGPAAGGVETPVRRLDDLVVGEPRVTLVKIDVEGFEKFVLEGAPATLGRTDCVFFESCDAHFARYAYAIEDVLRLLTAHGFTVYRWRPEAVPQPIPAGYASAELENLVAVRDPEQFRSRIGEGRRVGQDREAGAGPP